MYFLNKSIKKEKISSLIKRYYDELSEYQDDPFLSRIDFSIIEKIENSNENKIKKELEKLRKYIKEPFKLSFEKNKLNLFSTFNEIHNIWFLTKKGLNIEKIKEKLLSDALTIHKSNAEVAAALGITEKTVVNYLTILYDKAGVKNKREFLEKMGRLN